MNSTLRYLSALPLLALLSACIAFPTDFGDDEPFAEKRLAFIEVGKSTKEDIATAMPPLPIEFLGGDLWLYVKTRREAEWFLIVFSPSGGGTGELGGGTDYRYLVIRFDENGVVADYETSQSEKPEGCNRSGVCVSGSTYMLVAPEEQDRVANQFGNPADRCGVYVYGESRTAIHIKLDGHQVGALFGEQGFIVEQPYRGAHELIVSGPNVKGYTPIEFSCKAGSLVFFQITAERPGFFVGHFKIEVTQRDLEKGRQAINKRDLMLNADT